MGSYHVLTAKGSTALGGDKLTSCFSSSSGHGFLLSHQLFHRNVYSHKYRIQANAHNRKQVSTAHPTSDTLKTLQRTLSLDSALPPAPPLSSPQSDEGKRAGPSSAQVQDEVRTASGKSHLASNKPSAVFVLFRQVKRAVERTLSSFNLALAELAIIAALCALGTLIEQGQSKEFYLEKYAEDYAFGMFNGEWVLRLCLDHVYTAPYFLGLIACLAASLMACTSSRQLPLVKIARRWKFYNSGASVSKLPFHETLPRAQLADLGALLAADNYQVFVKGPALYAFKGLAGRFAPIGVHAALLLIMGGATYSAIGGYRGNVMVPQGLNFMIGEVMYPVGFLARPPDTFDTEVHVNRFSIETYPNGEVSQFRTDLSLFDLRGREVSRKEISVNKPLRYGGFTMYQTDWAISAFQVRVDGEGPYNLVAAPLQTGDNKLFGTFLPLGDTGLGEVKGISMLARDLQSVIVYDSSGAFVGVRRSGSGRPITVDGVSIIIDDVIGSTGLELKMDPGVPIVYAGFGALMLTTVISYLCHVQVWALQEGNSLLVGAKSNRNRSDFQEEFEKLLDFVPEIVKPENGTPPVVLTNSIGGLQNPDKSVG
ncbi:hypothetical protein GOP47_0004178 [Adiantum capillus-veneris]|uniref:ResB-like domain-containing protein n=1 Tax=Adiantum capillus-veneris TaxID=13818 RepID=A0A9D4ZQ50_ADICA|nr:hypothetical protein GOP47_0004178 [Adiantum capillus-veneris]